MPEEFETLTKLVAERVGDSRGMTYRAFESRAVDPVTGYRPSRNTLWKIVNGKGIQVSPALVGAIAVGLRLPLQRVQAAAAYQYTGYVATELESGTVVHEPGAGAENSKARAILDRWAEEESETSTQP